MTRRTDNTASPPSSETLPLQWSELESFFRQHGCLVAGNPELEWYRDAWGSLEKAGLASAVEFAAFGLDRTVVKLRVLCLVAMYLGIYQVVGEESALGGYPFGRGRLDNWLGSLRLDFDDIRELARQAGLLESEAESYGEDEGVDDEAPRALGVELIAHENEAIFSALVDRYGGTSGLFAALWNSTSPPDEAESLEDILDSIAPGDGKPEILAYVENGMTEWQLS